MAKNLHEVAVAAEANLEQLATGLAQSGADEKTVKAVSQMADVCRQIVKALGKGQEATGDDEGPAEDAAEPSEEPGEQPRSFDQASRQLTDEMRAKREAQS